MTYNTSRRVCVRMHRFLKELDQQRTTIDFHSRDPKRLAYNLREAMYACEFHSDFKKYVGLRDYYTFHVMNDRVRARFKGVPEPQVRYLEVERKAQKAGPKDTEDLLREIDELGGAYQETLDTLPIPKVETLSEAIGASLRYGEACRELHFPDLRLSAQDMGRLYRWAREKEWKLVDNLEGGITLTKKKVDPELVWTPEN